ncbi:metal-dependent transcriptional regulator [Haloplanus halobius]|uniref:metal-dependent transcriptional regulator n=1 Tax=Haloplanus halobius TaxID=2934938 RepID=UPI00200DF919|nr:metal-dependent transcriptional regulator [Haloplanus sp. XH21]
MSGASEYLLVLYIAEQGAGAPVPPGDVAEAVGRSPSATTEMLQRLAEQGLVTHEPYEGATLTADGRARAEEIHGTYTTLSRFFGEVLDLDDPEDAAMSVAGNISPAVANRLAATLLDGDPMQSRLSNGEQS